MTDGRQGLDLDSYCLLAPIVFACFDAHGSWDEQRGKHEAFLLDLYREVPSSLTAPENVEHKSAHPSKRTGTMFRC